MGHLSYVLIKQTYHFAFANQSDGSMKLQVGYNLRR